MDAKWRIKKTSSGYGETYTLQTKFLGFLWWYNPDNFDGGTTGVYRSLIKAQEAYKQKTTPITIELIDL